MPRLLREVKKFYKAHKRTLPWRKTRDPYKILVSEIMLQQTQVKRVLSKYNSFIKKFPTAKKLASAKLAEVLKEWQGLGYNRRGKYLWEAAKILSSAATSRHGTDVRVLVPRQRVAAEPSVEFWENLPGVGHYTARAVAAFAFNRPEIFVETNIRTVFLHFCFYDISKKISDTELLPLVAEALKRSKMQPRDFYAALMDYGAHLKANGIKLNARSKHYAKQSKFEGSTRQLRGAILRELLAKPTTLPLLTKNLARSRDEVERELGRLCDEGLIMRSRQGYAVAR